MLFTLRHLLTPHYSNNNRARLLHPAGLSVLIALFILSQSTLQLIKYAPALPEGFVLGYASNITASQVVELTNIERAKSGLPSLSYSSILSEAAAKKAAHMFSNDYWAHIAPDGTTPWTFIKNAGYSYTVAGENLARDFDATDTMIQAWMNSPTHKENIVNQNYSELGIAVVDGTLGGVETTLVVQMFGSPSSSQLAAVTPSIPENAPSEAAQTTEAEVVVAPTSLAQPVEEEAAGEETLPNTNIAVVDVMKYDSALGVTLDAKRDSIFSTTYLSPLRLTKAIAASIIMLVMAVLLYDTAYMHRKQLPRFVGKNWAHLTFFSLVIMFILGLTQGKVL